MQLEGQSSQNNNRKMCTFQKEIAPFNIAFFLKAFADFFSYTTGQ